MATIKEVKAAILSQQEKNYYQSGISQNLRGFRSHIELDGTGLVYMNARLYDPELGRFLSADSIVPDPTRWEDYNRYMYVRGNPMRYRDPSGHSPKSEDDDVVELEDVVVYANDSANQAYYKNKRKDHSDRMNGRSSAREAKARQAQARAEEEARLANQAALEEIRQGYAQKDAKPSLVKGVKVYRKDIDIGAEDKYGHWWIEIDGKESYGWWPKEPVDLKGTLLGVDGELNGQTNFGGTATLDPHHGDRSSGVNVFDVYSTQSRDTVIQSIRSFSNSYSGSWSWPIGQNCHSFQDALLDNHGMTIRSAP